MPKPAERTRPRRGAACADDPRVTQGRRARGAPSRPVRARHPIPTPTPPANGRLPLSPALRAQQAVGLRRRLATQLAGEIDLTVTDNRRVMISVRRDPSRRRYTVRLHHMFVDAPDAVIAAVARYVEREDPAASEAISAFIDARDHLVADAEPRPREVTIRTAGRHHDLAAIREQLERAYFDEPLDVRVTWGRNAARGRARRSIRLGSFDVEARLIRIHPGLDQPWVPRFYVAWVLYHEMLHAVHPPVIEGGRRRFHTAAFRADERAFRQHAEAIAWERRNVAALLCL